MRGSLPIVDNAPASPAHADAHADTDPTLRDQLWFHARALRQRVLRVAKDRGLPQRAPRASAEGFTHVLSSSSTPLWTNDDPLERPLVAGKVHNLRVAARRLDGAHVQPGGVLSFWGEVGPPWRARGFVDGRELREGCLVPSVGGGLCQLSNALYACALDAGLEVVERHAHTAKLEGLAGAPSSSARDATVYWQYVDLRVRAPLERHLVVRARVVADRLEVTLLAQAPPSPPPSASPASPASPGASGARPTLDVNQHACDTCNQAACATGDHARSRVRASARAMRTAFLVDEHIPELAALIARERGGRDLLALPLPGRALGMPQYAWDTSGVDVVTAATQAFARSRAMRALAREGARRVRAQLDASQAIARAYARALGPEVEHVVVAQSLLPFLWSDSALGGRRVDVFLHRLPLHLLHARLDAAAERFPDDPLLRAYRAPAWLVDAEREALAQARRLVTAHLDIARALPCELVPWHVPAGAAEGARAFDPDARRVVYVGPSSSRKGAHAVREAALALGLTVVLTGSELMDEGFWAGVVVERRSFSEALQRRVRAVVQPALVEDQPRRLLEALAAGVPVVTTSAAGLPAHALVRELPWGDALALTVALAEVRASVGPAPLATGPVR